MRPSHPAQNGRRGVRHGTGRRRACSCEANLSPRPEASAKMSHDFSAGVSGRVSGDRRSSGDYVVPGLARQETNLAFTFRAEQSRQRSGLVQTPSPARRSPTGNAPITDETGADPDR